ncbi:flagellar biosynthesis protein FlhB [Helicobacter monodelphidis]|uniref:flagellar biosynthesis protein FlhB n=1 Tax=Helicobacter sp. 15-1451 TaxID=2004995 RepID=UPI000DCC1BE2|nr:flagellar biosynthesis protein FlhB [Helicobacter sp. 15-1451]RAX58930.1 flagellar biosynthesis protein FlhB [Helicobacter sp. 15-1451]
MADEEEKTEEPSAKKIEKAREEGNVPKSPEVVGFFGLVVGFILLYVLFTYVVDRCMDIYHFSMSLFSVEMTAANVVSITLRFIQELFFIIAPFFAGLMIVAVASNVGQFGFLLTSKAIKFNLAKINPVSGFKNLFSIKKLVDGFLLTVKVLAAFGIGFWVFSWFIGELTTVALLPLYDQMRWLRDKAIILVAILLLFFFLMSAIDYVIKRRRYYKSLKMTKQEVKDEFKQQEGNPEIKGKIRSLMFQASRKRMSQAVPGASVVITNPTHYAVALRFDQAQESAPRVVAKGVDHLATRIKDIAFENDVPIVENPSLARELYKSVDIEEVIPEAMFAAVAEVLAYVYQANQEKGKLNNG